MEAAMRTISRHCAGGGGLGLIVKVICILVLAAALGPFPGAVKAAGETSRSTAVTGDLPQYRQMSRHTVKRGETLWAIALTYFPDQDPRCGVDSIISANGLERATLQVGAVLVIPPSATCA